MFNERECQNQNSIVSKVSFFVGNEIGKIGISIAPTFMSGW